LWLRAAKAERLLASRSSRLRTREIMSEGIDDAATVFHRESTVLPGELAWQKAGSTESVEEHENSAIPENSDDNQGNFSRAPEIRRAKRTAPILVSLSRALTSRTERLPSS